jgi:hypothetical protein
MKPNSAVGYIEDKKTSNIEQGMMNAEVTKKLPNNKATD